MPGAPTTLAFRTVEKPDAATPNRIPKIVGAADMCVFPVRAIQACVRPSSTSAFPMVTMRRVRRRVQLLEGSVFRVSVVLRRSGSMGAR